MQLVHMKFLVFSAIFLFHFPLSTQRQRQHFSRNSWINYDDGWNFNLLIWVAGIYFHCCDFCCLLSFLFSFTLVSSCFIKNALCISVLMNTMEECFEWLKSEELFPQGFFNLHHWHTSRLTFPNDGKHYCFMTRLSRTTFSDFHIYTFYTLVNKQTYISNNEI